MTRFILPVVVVFLFTGSKACANVAVTTLARLGGTPDGYDPQGALVDGGDGFFYGTTEAGGPANCGTVYRLAADGTLATLYPFTGTSDGANPMAGLVSGGDGSFYGTTSSGGNGGGTIFQITSAGVVTTLHSFAALDASLHNADGASPQAALVSGGDGFFYGTSASGGSNGLGTVFRVTASGVFNVVYSLSQSSDGSFPMAALTPGGDGFLYGATSSGGTGHGTIFRVTPAGVYKVLYNFTGGKDGGAPQSALVLSGGVFYGLTQSTFFSVTTAGVLTPLYTFNTPEGTGNFGNLIAGPGSNFYGTARRDSPDGTGNLFQLTPTGGFTLLHQFDTGADGANPAPAPVLDASGNLFGVTQAGGGGNDTGGGGGTVYEYSAAGVFSALHTFTGGGSYCASALFQDTDGALYGVTTGGGSTNAGTVFGVTSGGEFFNVHDFDPETEGSHPSTALVGDGSGNVYGSLASDGPGGGGGLFQLGNKAAAGSPATLRSDTRAGLRPRSGRSGFELIVEIYIQASEKDSGIGDAWLRFFEFYLYGPRLQATRATQAADAGYLYACSASGSTNGDGALFVYSLADGSPSLVHAFGDGANDGILPEGFVQGTDGNLYGITYGGGKATQGTIFKLTQDGTYSVLYSFQGAGDGAYPQTNLTAGSDGNLYGVTTSGNGTIFAITPDGVFNTRHTFASDGSEGSQPMAELLQASDGNLYGTTQDGVLFSISHGGQFTRLYRQGYDAATGAYDGSAGVSLAGAVAPLIQAADGTLYGTTTNGGTDSAGVLFKVVLNVPATPVVTVAVSGDGEASQGRTVGKAFVSRTGDTSAALTVSYKVAGSARSGIEYKPVMGTVTIPAGAAKAKIKIKPISNPTLDGTFVAKIKLKASPDGSYLLGTSAVAKIKVIDND